MNLRKESEIIAAAFSFLAFAAALRISGVSASTLVGMQNIFLKSFVAQSATEIMSLLVLPFISVFIAFIFLVLGFAFLCLHGYKSGDYRTGIYSGIFGAVFVVLATGTSLPGIFLAAALIISSAYIVPLSYTYSKELKKWVFFRVGSNAIGKALMIINMLLALGIFLSVASNMSFYGASFRNDIKQSMTDIAMASAPASIPDRAALEAKVAESVDSMPIINSYVRWLPILTAVLAWFALEFLRLLLSNIGGIFTKILFSVSKSAQS